MIKNKCIIHIGAPKTGGTFLQKKIFPQLECIFINQFQSNKYKNVYNNFIKLCTSPSLNYNKHNLINSIKKLKLSSKQTLVFSKQDFISFRYHLIKDYEKFWGERTLDSNLQFQRLKEIFLDIEILYVVRNINEILKSNFLYLSVKNQIMIDVKKFFFYNNFKAIDLKTGHFPNMNTFCKFGSIIESLDKIFGKTKVHILNYDELKNKPKRFLEDVQSKIGVKCKEKVKLTYNRVNVTDTTNLINIISSRSRFFKFFPKSLSYFFSKRKLNSVLNDFNSELLKMKKEIDKESRKVESLRKDIII